MVESKVAVRQEIPKSYDLASIRQSCGDLWKLVPELADGLTHYEQFTFDHCP